MKSVLKYFLVASIVFCHAAPTMADWTWSPAKNVADMFPWISYKFTTDSAGNIVLTWIERSYIYEESTYFTDTIKYRVYSKSAWSAEKQLGAPITGYAAQEIFTATNNAGEVAIGWTLVESKERPEDEIAKSRAYFANLDIKKDILTIAELNEFPISIESLLLNDAGKIIAVGHKRFEYSDILSAATIDGNKISAINNIGKGDRPMSVQESNGDYLLIYASPDRVDGSAVGSSFLMKGVRLDGTVWHEIDPILIDAPYGRVYFLSAPELHTSKEGKTILSFNVNRDAYPSNIYRPYIYILDKTTWNRIPSSSSQEQDEKIQSITLSSDNTITQLSVSNIDSAPCNEPPDDLRIKRYKNNEWIDISPAKTAASWATLNEAKDNSIIHAWIEKDGQSLRTAVFKNNKWSPSQTIQKYPASNDTFILYPEITTRPDGSALLHWLYGGNSSVSILTSFGAPNDSDPITLAVKKIGEGIISSEPAGINCGPACVNKFKYGNTVSLIAKPSNGYNFGGWNNQCGATSKCDIALFEDTIVTATFDRASGSILTTTKSNRGIISSSPAGISCGNAFNSCLGSFDAVTLTATPNPGYYLKKWLGCPSPTGNICSLTLTKKTTVGAVFAKLPKYALKVVKTKNGEITSDPAGLKCKVTAKTCSFSFVSGTRVTLNPIPVPGYNFSGWSGACSGTGACEVLMDAKQSVGAQFE